MLSTKRFMAIGGCLLGLLCCRFCEASERSEPRIIDYVTSAPMAPVQYVKGICQGIQAGPSFWQQTTQSGVRIIHGEIECWFSDKKDVRRYGYEHGRVLMNQWESVSQSIEDKIWPPKIFGDER